MKKGADVDAIEEILRIVMEGCPRSDESLDEEHPPQEEVSTATEEEGKELVTAKKHSDRLLTWITKLSSLEKFDLMMRFANKTLLDKVRAYVSSRPSASISVKEKLGL